MSFSPLAYALTATFALFGAPSDTKVAEAEAEDVIAPPASVAVALPSCDGPASADDETGRGTFDCSLTFDGNPPLTFNVSYAPVKADPDNAQDVSIDLVSSQGQVIQTLKATSEFAYGTPQVTDVNLDGRPELLVPLMTGNVNTVFGLWTQSEQGPFIRVGEISSLGGVDPRGDGLFSTSIRASAASWFMSFYRLNNDELVEVAVTEFTLSDSGERQTCNVLMARGLAYYGPSSEEARSVFCSMD